MSQLGDIASEVVEEYLGGRDDLLNKALNAGLRVYRRICSKVPFPELHVVGDEISMVEGTSSYNLASLDPYVLGIRSIRMTLGSTTRRPRRSHPRVYDSLGNIQNGIPATYAREGNTLEFNPPPNSSSFTFRLRYWGLPSGIPTRLDSLETKSNFTLITPPEWDELIGWEILYILYIGLEKHQEATLLRIPAPTPRAGRTRKIPLQEMGIIPVLWNDMMTTSLRRERGDEDFSINPVIRPYTATAYGR